MEFAEYGIKYSKDARRSRREIPTEHLPVLDEIENDLAEDPDKHSDRLIPVSRDGRCFVYSHPSPPIQVTFEIDREDKIIYFRHFVELALQVRKTIFISYSHKDSEWLQKLRIFLSVLEQEGLIKLWDDQQIQPGVLWEKQIKEILDSAAAGILLVSQDFLASNFIRDTELPSLLDSAVTQGKKIFWIPLSPSTVFDSHKEITKYQSLLPDPATSLEERSDAEQKKAFVQISRSLRDAVASH